MMILQQHSEPQTRRGLTLIELLVVLMILIALGGLLAPMLPSMLTRAHTSTTVTSISEAARAIVTYQQLYSQYPNNWDALGNGTQIIDYFANGNAYPASQGGTGAANMDNNEVMTLTLLANEASALTGVGITTLQGMYPTYAALAAAGGDPTFNYYPATNLTPASNAIPIATGTVLAGMDPTAAGPNSTTYARCVTLNLSLTGRYVFLGIGPRNSMIGKTVQTPPVHFGDTPVLNPEYGYMRFVAVFKVSDSAVGANFTQAQLVGVASIEDVGLGGIQDHLQAWYQLTTGGS
jgi:type II secretory pathway pseudopilin PulG